MERLSERGFGLVEVLASLTILAFASLSIYQFFITPAHSSETTEDYLTALNLARSKVEQLQGTPFSSLSSASVTQGKFQVTVTVTPATRSGAAVSNLDDVDVKVTWPTGNPNNKVELATSIANRQ